MTSLGRVLIYAWKNFARNAWIGLATVFVLILSLLSVNVLIGVSALLDRAVSTLEEKVDITIYFKVDTPEAILQQAQFFLAGLPHVKQVTLLTPAQALENFKARHGDDQAILQALEEVDANPLGASLIVKARQADDYPFLLEALQNPQFDFAIEKKSYDDHAEAIATVRHIGRSIRLFGTGLVAVFGFFSILIVYNAIRVAIYTQREEIKIMRLVGASNMFVRAPFIIEGVVLGLVALMITAGIVALLIASLEPKLLPIFDGVNPGLKDFFLDRGWLLIIYESAVLSALVIFSSWAAVGKYLKK